MLPILAVHQFELKLSISPTPAGSLGRLIGTPPGSSAEICRSALAGMENKYGTENSCSIKKGSALLKGIGADDF
jgi:hypothetical protein